MAHHDEYVELISAAIDGALSPDEQTRLEEHLAACPDCKALYDDLKAVHQALLDLPPAEVPAGLTERIMEAVAADNVTPLPRPKKSAFQWKKTVAAAAVLALVLAGVGTMNGSLNAVKNALPENTMSDFQDKESEEMAPVMGVRTTEGVSDEEAPVLAQGYRAVPEPTDGVAETDTPASDSFTVQVAAKQTPTASQSEQPAEMVPEPQDAETFTIGDITDLLEGDADSEATIDLPVSLFVLPTGMESPESTDNAIAAERAPDEQDEKPNEALSLLAEFLWSEKMPEGMQKVDTEEFFGYATPLVSQDGEDHSQQVSTRLEYLGLTPNGKYHEFWLYSFLLDDPETGLAHSSTLNFFAVPLDGGEILVQRQEIDLPDGTDKTGDIDEIMELYLAGIAAYHEAISN
ncbi:MAG: zf-HC2 domain-containing protein [Oscillospiraceae bacterium]|nr:zf-HC2 domain-containing protein [Oscillospiraceae bacterium]